MTTTTKKKSGNQSTVDRQKHIPQRKASVPKKPLRIRPELLPDSATYGTFADKEYVMIPVEDFGEWYEDIALGAIAEDRIENATEPPLSLAPKSNEAGKRKAKK